MFRLPGSACQLAVAAAVQWACIQYTPQPTWGREQEGGGRGRGTLLVGALLSAKPILNKRQQRSASLGGNGGGIKHLIILPLW